MCKMCASAPHWHTRVDSRHEDEATVSHRYCFRYRPTARLPHQVALWSCILAEPNVSAPHSFTVSRGCQRCLHHAGVHRTRVKRDICSAPGHSMEGLCGSNRQHISPPRYAIVGDSPPSPISLYCFEGIRLYSGVLRKGDEMNDYPMIMGIAGYVCA